MSKQTNDQDDAQKTSADALNDDAQQTASSTTAADNNQQRRGNSRGHKGGSNTSSRTTGKAEASKAGNTASDANKSDTSKPDISKPDTSKSGDGAKSSSTASTPASSGGSQTPPPTAAPAQGGSNKGGGSKSGVFAIVLVLVLAVALALITWQGWLRLESQQQHLDELAQQVGNSATQEDIAALNERLESGEAQRNQALENTTSQMQEAFSAYRSDVNGTLDQVLAQLSQEQDADEREWLHAEAAYLLRLANQRLQLERDVEGAAALLRTADNVLVSANNPALTSVRREIASELAALDAVPRVDRTGIYLALNAQQERIASLRLAQEVEEQAVASSIEEPPTGTFQRQLARFGSELKDLVVVRDHDEAMETLITPEQESYLRQSLRLILEQSQLAVLKEEQELFEASIDKALGLLNRYYDTSRSETQGVIARLEEIKQTNVTPELPDISRSQQALAEFIENRFESRGGEA
ncbi:uroporphyrinogen-III C-methyltransferase [Halomonas sp. LS-001]